MDLFSIAIDPEQYSKGDASKWIIDKGHQSIRSDTYWSVLKPVLSQIKPRNLLDIGAGSAWVYQRLNEIGSVDYEGIEPSVQSFNLALKNYPDLRIEKISFEGFYSANKYDAILAVMVLSHISNIDEFFVKIKMLLNMGGLCLVIIPEFYEDERQFKRNGKEYDVQILNENEYVDRSKNTKQFALADIVRKPNVYIECAEKHGLKLDSQKEFADNGFSTKTLLVFK